MEEGGEEEAKAKHMRRRRSAVRSTSYIALTIIIAIFIFLGLGTLLNTSFPLLVVKTGSMRPVIEVGDIIIVAGTSFEDIYASPIDGDVIVYQKPGPEGALIVHRAIKKTPEGIITKGDANDAPDPWSPIPPDNIVGKWIGLKIPYWTGLGYLSLILRGEIMQPLGYLLILFIILVNAVFIIRDISK